jgi:hypothetical protein
MISVAIKKHTCKQQFHFDIQDRSKQIFEGAKKEGEQTGQTAHFSKRETTDLQHNKKNQQVRHALHPCTLMKKKENERGRQSRPAKWA